MINTPDNKNIKQILVEALSLNSDSDIRLIEHKNGEANYEFIGNQTECCLLKLIDSMGINYSEIRQNRKIIKRFPFNSTRKNNISVYKYADRQSRVILTGASE